MWFLAPWIPGLFMYIFKDKIQNLTNKVHSTDVTNASRTFLMDLQTLEWSETILNDFKIPKQCLPSIKPSSFDFGEIVKTELKGKHICSVMGDQQAAAIGHGLFEKGSFKRLKKGDIKNTYGTGCFLLVNIGNEFLVNEKGLITTVLY